MFCFTMVFTVATIAFNGFRWFQTIGQTMRWFQWIVVVQMTCKIVAKFVRQANENCYQRIMQQSVYESFLQLVFGLLCPLLCTGKADYHGGGFPRSRDSTMTRNWFLVVFRHKFLLLCDHSTRWGSLLFILESHPLSFDKGGLNSVERAGQSRPAQMCHIKFLFPNLFRIAPKITLGRCNCCF